VGKRFYRKPKFGWGLPRLNPHPKLRAARQQRIPRAFSRQATAAYSDARLEQGADRLFSGRGGVLGRVISRILRRLGIEQRRRLKPPDRPKEYTIDIR